MKTILGIAQKTLLEMIREKQILLIIFLFPILLIAMYAIAYGDTAAGLSSQLKLAVLNQQTEISSGLPAYDQDLLRYLEALELDGQPLFSISEVQNKNTALSALQEQQYLALLIIPPNFSESISSAEQPAQLEIIGDTYSAQFTFTQSFLTGALEDFNTELQIVKGTQDDTVRIQYTFLEGTGTLSDLDFGLPGILVFGLMFLSISTTQLLVREKTDKTLLRYRLSGTPAWMIFFGLTLSQVLIALILVPFTILAASWMGFQPRGSYVPLLLFSSVLTIAAVGIGLIVSCFTRNESEAINISSSIVVPLVLLSNTLYPIEKQPIFRLFGFSFSIPDLLPTSVAADLLRNSMIYLMPFTDLFPWFAWLCIQTLVIFAFGSWLFSFMLFRNQKA